MCTHTPPIRRTKKTPQHAPGHVPLPQNAPKHRKHGKQKQACRHTKPHTGKGREYTPSQVGSVHRQIVLKASVFVVVHIKHTQYPPPRLQFPPLYKKTLFSGPQLAPGEENVPGAQGGEAVACCHHNGMPPRGVKGDQEAIVPCRAVFWVGGAGFECIAEVWW